MELQPPHQDPVSFSRNNFPHFHSLKLSGDQSLYFQIPLILLEHSSLYAILGNCWNLSRKTLNHHQHRTLPRAAVAQSTFNSNTPSFLPPSFKLFSTTLIESPTRPLDWVALLSLSSSTWKECDRPSQHLILYES